MSASVLESVWELGSASASGRRLSDLVPLGCSSLRQNNHWEQYRQRYLEEMQAEEPRELIAGLAELAAEGKTITLLCSSACEDASHCHRTLLRELIEAQVRI